MIYNRILKLALCTAGAVTLTACATTDTESVATATTTPAAVEKVAEPQTVTETASALSATNGVSTSADGNIKCKRQAVIGSNFKRKVCMTQAQWNQIEEESRSTAENIQRRGGAPGGTN